MTDDDYTPQEMVDWLRQKDDVRVCQSHGIKMCRVNPSPREMFAAKQIEMLMARVAELEAAMKAARDIEQRVWIDALLENLPEEKAVLFREICLSAEKIRAARAALEKDK